MWAAAAVCAIFEVVWVVLKLSRSMSYFALCIFVQERLLEGCFWCLFFGCWRWLHQLESLILAQNERWRHA